MLLDAPFIEDDWRAMMVPVDGSGETQWTQWWQWMAVVAALSGTVAQWHGGTVPQWWQLSVLEKVDFSR